jgi:hypothetical protein
MSSQTSPSAPIIFSGAPNNSPTQSLVLSCIDPRFAYATEQYLYDRYTSNGQSYDHFVLAGSALGGNLTGTGSGSGQCAVLSSNSNWNQTLKDHIQIAITLHNVKEVEILDHLNCGAYGECKGATTGPTGDQNVSLHKTQYISLANSITGATFFSHNSLLGTTAGNNIFTAGVTGGYFNGYATSPTTTLIDYGGANILTELKGTNSGAKVLVLGCIDPRYSSVLSSFLREYKNVQFVYDLFILAGASIGSNQSYTTFPTTVRAQGNAGSYPNNVLADGRAGIGDLGRQWGPAFFDHLAIARLLHDITEVWVFDHLDCGAYKAIYYGDLSNPDSDVAPHVAEMVKLKANINTYTAAQSPAYSLGFKGFIIDMDGNVGKYVDGNSVYSDTSPSTLAGTPVVPLRDSSDFTRMLKQSMLYREFRSGVTGPVDYRITQSNQNRKTFQFGEIVCGCTGAFPTSSIGDPPR